MRGRTLDAATTRRLSVKADCDPRTLLKVLGGKATNSMSAKRARAVLTEAGFLVEARDETETEQSEAA